MKGSLFTRSKRNGKYKGRKRTNLNYPKLQHGKKNPKTKLKTTQKLLFPILEKPQGIYRKKGN